MDPKIKMSLMTLIVVFISVNSVTGKAEHPCTLGVQVGDSCKFVYSKLMFLMRNDTIRNYTRGRLAPEGRNSKVWYSCVFEQGHELKIEVVQINDSTISTKRQHKFVNGSEFTEHFQIPRIILAHYHYFRTTSRVILEYELLRNSLPKRDSGIDYQFDDKELHIFRGYNSCRTINLPSSGYPTRSEKVYNLKTGWLVSYHEVRRNDTHVLEEREIIGYGGEQTKSTTTNTSSAGNLWIVPVIACLSFLSLKRLRNGRIIDK